MELAPRQYRLLADPSANQARVLTYQHLLRRVWGSDGDALIRPMRTAFGAICGKLGDDPGKPTRIFTKPRVCCSMPLAEAR